MLALAVAVVLTLGAASPAAGGLIAATRIAIQQIFKRLIAQLGKKALKKSLKEAGQAAAKQLTTKAGLKKLGKEALDEGFDEAREEFAINLGTQAYQNTTGRRDGIDFADLGMTTLGGFAGGAAASGAMLGKHSGSRRIRERGPRHGRRDPRRDGWQSGHGRRAARLGRPRQGGHLGGRRIARRPGPPRGDPRAGQSTRRAGGHPAGAWPDRSHIDGPAGTFGLGSAGTGAGIGAPNLRPRYRPGAVRTGSGGAVNRPWHWARPWHRAGLGPRARWPGWGLDWAGSGRCSCRAGVRRFERQSRGRDRPRRSADRHDNVRWPFERDRHLGDADRSVRRYHARRSDGEPWRGSRHAIRRSARRRPDIWPTRHGPSRRACLGWTGLVRACLGWAGLVRACVGWACVGWACVVWTGLVWACVGWAGHLDPDRVDAGGIGSDEHPGAGHGRRFPDDRRAGELRSHTVTDDAGKPFHGHAPGRPVVAFAGRVRLDPDDWVVAGGHRPDADHARSGSPRARNRPAAHADLGHADLGHADLGHADLGYTHPGYLDAVVEPGRADDRADPRTGHDARDHTAGAFAAAGSRVGAHGALGLPAVRRPAARRART